MIYLFKKNRSLRSFNEAASIVKNTSKKIQFISDFIYFGYVNPAKVVNLLSVLSDKLKNVKVLSLQDEIWAQASYPDKYLSCEILINKHFYAAINWKSHIVDVESLQSNLNRDVEDFFFKKARARHIFDDLSKKRIMANYLEIGLKLFYIRTEISVLKDNLKALANKEEPDLLNNSAVVRNDTVENEIPSISHNSNTDELFPSLLLFSQKEKLAQKIKEVFSTETGKSIRLLLIALESNEPPLISVGNRKLKLTYNALKSYLNRDIGTYQSVAGFNYDKMKDKPGLDSIRQKLKHCLAVCDGK